MALFQKIQVGEILFQFGQISWYYDMITLRISRDLKAGGLEIQANPASYRFKPLFFGGSNDSWDHLPKRLTTILPSFGDFCRKNHAEKTLDVSNLYLPEKKYTSIDLRYWTWESSRIFVSWREGHLLELQWLTIYPFIDPPSNIYLHLPKKSNNPWTDK